MAINFPSDPEIDEEFTADDKTWYWDGEKWIFVSTSPQSISAESPITYEKVTQIIGIDESLVSIGPAQVTGTAIIAGDSRLISFVTSSTRPSTPTEGQIIYETNTDKYFGWKGAEWSAIGGGAAYSSSAPANAQLGDLWIDSDAAAATLSENDFKLKADAIIDSDWALLQSTMGVM
jgi:hypothetical protein